ncbi:hypothetical protein LLG95_01580 [bacterium]|nr:hypothetical protein [bacterium]
MNAALIRLLIITLLFAITGTARADVIVMKSGQRIETTRAFHMSGATYFYRNGQMTSVPDADVERIEAGAVLPPPPKPAIPSPRSKLLEAAKAQINKSDADLVHECRLAIESEARLNKSDYKETCAKAMQMVERMYDGEMPADGTFGYYLEVFNGPILWGMLPADKSKKLKDTIYKKDSPFDKFNKSYEVRMKEAAVKAAIQREEALRIQKAVQARAAQLEKARKTGQPLPQTRGSLNRSTQNKRTTTRHH